MNCLGGVVERDARPPDFRFLKAFGLTSDFLTPAFPRETSRYTPTYTHKPVKRSSSVTEHLASYPQLYTYTPVFRAFRPRKGALFALQKRLLYLANKPCSQCREALFWKRAKLAATTLTFPRPRDRQAHSPQASPPRCSENTFIPALYTYFSTITGDNCLLIISVLQYLFTLIHIQQAKHRFLVTAPYSQDMWITPQQARLWLTAGTVCQCCEKGFINTFIHTL